MYIILRARMLVRVEKKPRWISDLLFSTSLRYARTITKLVPLALRLLEYKLVKPREFI